MKENDYAALPQLVDKLANASSGSFRLLLTESDNQQILAPEFETVLVNELRLTAQAMAAVERAGFQTVADVILAYPFYDARIVLPRSIRMELSTKLEHCIRYTLIRDEIHREENAVQAASSAQPADDEESPQAAASLSADNSVNENLFSQLADSHYMSVPIDVLDLSVRSYNVLRRAGIANLFMLAMRFSDLNSVKNLGTKSYNEIINKLERFCENNVDKQDESVETPDESMQETQISAEDRAAYEGIDAVEFFMNPLYHDHVISWFQLNEISLEELQLSTRSHNSLCRAGFRGASDMLSLFPDGYALLQNVGKSSVSELCVKSVELLREKKFLFIPYCNKCICEQATPENVSTLILDLHKNVGFRGLSFKDYREQVPEAIPDLTIKRAVGLLLAEHKLEYVDFRCYRVYPRFVDMLQDLSISEQQKQVLLRRMHGETLEQIGDMMGITRERVRQIESKAFRKIKNQYNTEGELQCTDEDYYQYLFEHYYLSMEVWNTLFPETQSTYEYLQLWFKKGSASLEEALNDEKVETSIKLRIEVFLDRQRLHIHGDAIEKKRPVLETYILKHYCRDEVTFQTFADKINQVLQDNGVPFDENLYYTEDIQRYRMNRISAHPNVLWKQGSRLRYYDFSSYDFTELLDTLGLDCYENTLISTYRWVRTMPELMQKYDIRDEYELHSILKKIVPEGSYHGIRFSRQPNILFGEFDRDKAVFDIISALSPVRQEVLVEQLQNTFGCSESYIFSNLLVPFSMYLHGGVYSVDCMGIPNERKAALADALTADFYFFDEVRSIYRSLYPDADPDEVNPHVLKAMGYTVNSTYILTHYSSAEQFFVHLLTEQKVFDLKQYKVRYGRVMMFHQTIANLRKKYTIFFYEPDQIIHFSRLEKMGVTKAEFTAFCDQVDALTDENSYFTMFSLRQNGMDTTLDRLGFDDYFLSSILELDERFQSHRIFGNTVLCKGMPDMQITKRSFILSLMGGRFSMTMDAFMDKSIERYGISIPEKYEITEAVAGSGMYYDPIMEKVYRDKSYYYAELDEMETEGNL